MMFKRPLQFVIFVTLGCFLLGFICWLIGNPDFKHPSAFRDSFNTAGIILILLGDIGLAAYMDWVIRGRSHLARFGAFAVAATVLPLLSLFILFLEYGVLNFGDSDLPPYQPDTLFERSFDFAWFVVTIGAGIFWSGTIFHALMSLSKFLKQRMA